MKNMNKALSQKGETMNTTIYLPNGIRVIIAPDSDPRNIKMFNEWMQNNAK